jgi:micrococcal nuclease
MRIANRFSQIIVLFGLVGCCLGFVGCQADRLPQGEWAEVTRVVSGQTIEVLDPTGRDPIAKQVRLLSIEAPDWNAQKPWSLAARQRLEALIGSDKRVWLEFDVTPDRTTEEGIQLRLAYLWHGNTLLNETLVAEGQVLAASRSPNLKYEQRLSYAQEQARLLGVGIWNPQNPMRQDPKQFAN